MWKVTDLVQSVCSFMWHSEIMNWWGPVPVKPMEEVIYQVNCIAVSTTTDTLPLDMQFILGWSIPVKIIKIVISQTVLFTLLVSARIFTLAFWPGELA